MLYGIKILAPVDFAVALEYGSRAEVKLLTPDNVAPKLHKCRRGANASCVGVCVCVCVFFDYFFLTDLRPAALST